MSDAIAKDIGIIAAELVIFGVISLLAWLVSRRG